MEPQGLLKWLARQEQAVWLAVVQQQLLNRRECLNNKRRDNQKAVATPEEELSFLLKAVASLYRLSKRRNLTIFQNLQLADTIEQAKVQKKSRKRKAVKRDAIDGLKDVILALRENGETWQSISDYIAKHHKKRIDVGYLYKLMHTKLSK